MRQIDAAPVERQVEGLALAARVLAELLCSGFGMLDGDSTTLRKGRISFPRKTYASQAGIAGLDADRSHGCVDHDRCRHDSPRLLVYDHTVERAVHDRGGWSTDAPVDRTEHELADWEILMDALVGTLGSSGAMNVDELRRGIESMQPDEYERASYYERWLFSVETILDRERRARSRRARREACLVTYVAGQPVRVAARDHAGHHRTPDYLKGKPGRVERLHASFTNPETRAYGTDGLPAQPLYLVSFAQRDVWPDYEGDASDRVYVDVFEHWLEAAG